MELIEAAHAHLHIAANAIRFRRVGVELVLIVPDAFGYSGGPRRSMGTGAPTASTRRG